MKAGPAHCNPAAHRVAGPGQGCSTARDDGERRGTTPGVCCFKSTQTFMPPVQICRGKALALQNGLKREPGRKTGAEAGGDGRPARQPRKRPGTAGDVGDALKSAYQRTINEDIPPEMLDLLGKLD